MHRLALLALCACACRPAPARSSASAVDAVSESAVDTRCASLRAEALATLAAAQRDPGERDGIPPTDIQQLPSIFGVCVPAGTGAWVITLDRLARGGCHGFCAEVDYSLRHVAPDGSIDGSFDLEPGEGAIIPYRGWRLSLEANPRDTNSVRLDESMTTSSAYSGDDPVTTTTDRVVREFELRSGVVEEHPR